MTVSEYEMAQVKKALQQVVIGAVMVGFIHYKWAIVQPLFLQSIMGPMGLYKNPVNSHHFQLLTYHTDVQELRFEGRHPKTFQGRKRQSICCFVNSCLFHHLIIVRMPPAESPAEPATEDQAATPAETSKPDETSTVRKKKKAVRKEDD